MISDERINQIANAHKANNYGPVWPHGFARDIEREAIAEPMRLMREFVDANESKSLVRYVAAERAMLDYLERMK